MNRRSEYRKHTTAEDFMFKKLKRGCMKEYNKSWRVEHPEQSFKDFYNMVKRDHHLDYIRYSYRAWKNGPGMSVKRSKKAIMKTLSKKVDEYEKDIRKDKK